MVFWMKLYAENWQRLVLKYFYNVGEIFIKSGLGVSDYL